MPTAWWSTSRSATEVLRSVLGEFNLRNLDDDPAFKGQQHDHRIPGARRSSIASPHALRPASSGRTRAACRALRVTLNESHVAWAAYEGRAAGAGGLSVTLRCSFLVPGDLGTRTGGYGYDRQIIAGLRALRLAGRCAIAGRRLPDARCRWRCALARRVAEALPDGTLVVVDGLAFGALADAGRKRMRARLRWVALVHHPLALETGLGAGTRHALFESERRALATARGVIVTSASTARALAAFGVAARAHRRRRAGHRCGAARGGVGRRAPWRCCAWRPSRRARATRC